MKKEAERTLVVKNKIKPVKQVIEEADAHKGINPRGQSITFWNNGKIVSGDPKSSRVPQIEIIAEEPVDLTKKAAASKRLAFT